VSAGLWMAALNTRTAARWFLWPMGAIVLLFAFLFFTLFKKTRGPANWLLRLTPAGQVTVKFRSYANAHFPPEDIVAFTLEPREIRWARPSGQQIITLTDEGTQSTHRRHLELAVDEAIARQIDEYIRLERSRQAPETGRLVKSRSKMIDYPVSVVDGQIIRITWRGESACVTPKLQRALDLLAKHVKVEPSPPQSVHDFTSATRDDAEDKILDLAEAGNQLAAIRLARKVYKCSLTEAKQLVDGLTDKKEVNST